MKRIVSILLTLAMLLTITPSHAFAASSGVTETVVSARSGSRQPMEPVVLYEPEQTPPDGISYAEVRLPTTVTGEGDRVEQGGPVSVVFHNGEGDEFAPGGELEYLWFYDSSFDYDAVDHMCPVGVSLSRWQEAVGESFKISEYEFNEDYDDYSDYLQAVLTSPSTDSMLESLWTAESTVPAYTSNDFDLTGLDPSVYADGLRAYVLVAIRWRASVSGGWSYYDHSGSQLMDIPMVEAELKVNGQYAGDLIGTPLSGTDDYPRMTVDLTWPGEGGISYQWYKSATDSYDGEPIEGETSADFQTEYPEEPGTHEYYYCVAEYGQGQSWKSDIFDVYLSAAQGIDLLTLVPMEFYMGDLDRDREALSLNSDYNFYIYNYYDNRFLTAVGDEGTVSCYIEPQGARFTEGTCDYLSYQWYRSDTKEDYQSGELLASGQIEGVTAFDNASITGGTTPNFGKLNQHANIHITAPATEAGSYWLTVEVTVHCDGDTNTAVAQQLITVVETREELYEVTSDGTVTAYHGLCSEIGIPDEIGGVAVKKLGAGFTCYSSFESSRCGLKKITLPEGLESIDASALRLLISLEEISFPSTLTVIGDSAFEYTGLRSVEFHPDVFPEALGDYAFKNCKFLAKVVLPRNAEAKITGKGTFEACSALELVENRDNLVCENLNSNFYGTPVLAMLLSDAEDDGVLYYAAADDGSGWAVTGYLGSPTAVTIPDTFNGLPVTEIGASAFRELAGLTEVVLGQNVAKIGAYAFCDCGDLVTVNFADAPLTEIGAYAFGHDYRLASPVTLSPGCTVRHHAFFECYSITEAAVGGCRLENASFNWCVNLEEIDGEWDRLFEVVEDGKTCLYDNFLMAKALDVTTEASTFVYTDGNYDGVTYEHLRITYYRVGDIAYSQGEDGVWYAEYYLDPFASDITIPGSVTLKGETVTPVLNVNLFSRLLTDRWDITVEDGVEEILSYGYGRIASFRFPDTVKSFTQRLFYLHTGESDGSPYLEAITLPASLTDIPEYAFGRCYALKSVTFGEGWTTPLPTGMFFFCTALEEIELPDSLTEVPREAFRGCTALSRVHLPQALTTIGAYAFANTWSLEEIEFPASFRSFDTNYNEGQALSCAFASSALRRVDLSVCPELAAIPDRTFLGTRYLEELILGDGVLSIGDDAFNKNPLPAEYFDGAEEDIVWEYGSREEYKALSEVRWPENLKSIGSEAFYNAFFAPETEPAYILALPDSVESIGDYAFGSEPWKSTSASGALWLNNLDLNDGNLPAGLRSIGEYAFASTRLSAVMIPEGMTAVGDHAFDDVGSEPNRLTQVTLHDGVTEIGDRAFSSAHLDLPDGKLTLPVSLKRLGNFAFYETNPSEYVFPAGIEYIGGDFCPFDSEGEALTTYTVTVLNPDGALPMIDREAAVLPDCRLVLRCYADSAAHVWGKAMLKAYEGTEYEGNFSIELLSDSEMLRLLLKKPDGSMVGESELSSVRWYDETLGDGAVLSTQTSLSESVDPTHLYRVDAETTEALRFEYLVPDSLVLYVDPGASPNAEFTLTARETVTYTGSLPQLGTEGLALTITVSGYGNERVYGWSEEGTGAFEIPVDPDTKTFRIQLPRIGSVLQLSVPGCKTLVIKDLQAREAVDGIIELGAVETEKALLLDYPLRYVESGTNSTCSPDFRGEFSLYDRTQGVRISGFTVSSSLRLPEEAIELVTAGDILELGFTPESCFGDSLAGPVTVTALSAEDGAGRTSVPILRAGELSLNAEGSDNPYVRFAVFDGSGALAGLGAERFVLRKLVPGDYTVLVWNSSGIRSVPGPAYFEELGLPGEYWLKETVTVESGIMTELTVERPEEFRLVSGVGDVCCSVTVDNAHATVDYVPVYLTFWNTGDLASLEKTFTIAEQDSVTGSFVAVGGSFASLAGEGEVTAVSKGGGGHGEAELTITTTAAEGTICFYARPLGQTVALTKVAVAGVESRHVYREALLPLFTYEITPPADSVSRDSGNLQLWSASAQNARALVFADGELCSDVVIPRSAVKRAAALPYSFETYGSAGTHTLQVVVVKESFAGDQEAWLDILLDDEAWADTVFYTSDVYSVLYTDEPAPAPLRLVISADNGETTNWDGVNRVETVTVDFLEKTAEPLKFVVTWWNLNEDGTMINDYTLDYRLTMRNPELVKPKSVSLEVYCGENLPTPTIRSVPLKRDPETGDFVGTLVLKGGTVSANDMPYYVYVNYSYTPSSDTPELSDAYLNRLAEDKAAFYKEIMAAAEEENALYEDLRVDMEEVELFLAYACEDYTEEEKQEVRELFAWGNTLADEHDAAAAALEEAVEAIALLAAGSAVTGSGGGRTEEELIAMGARAVSCDGSTLYVLFGEKETTVYDPENDSTVTFLLDAGLVSAESLSPRTYASAASRIVRAGSLPGGSPVVFKPASRGLLDGGKLMDDGFSFSEAADTATAVRTNAILPVLDFVDEAITLSSEVMLGSAQSKIPEEQELIRKLEKSLEIGKSYKPKPGQLDLSKLVSSIQKNLDKHKGIVESLESGVVPGNFGKLGRRYATLQKVSGYLTRLRAALFSPSASSALIKEATTFANRLIGTQSVKVLGSVLMFGGILLDVLGIVSSYYDVLDEIDKTTEIIYILAEDLVKCRYAYERRYNYRFKSYVEDEKKQMDKANAIYKEFCGDLYDEYKGYVYKSYSSIATCTADIATALTALLLPKQAALVTGLGATIVSTYSSAFADSKRLKNYLEIDDDWDEFQREVRDPVTRDTPGSDGDPDGSGSGNGLRGKRDGTATPLKPMIDPAGYAYEAVASNRVEGVTARVYYRDPDTGEAVYWDEADYYGEVNPQVTGEDGTFSWYTPVGRWLVVLEKEGYEQATSENDPEAEDGWLPVPPPQLSVYIPMVSEAAPQVEEVTAAPEGVRVQFSQYMDIASLEEDPSLLALTEDGNAVPFVWHFTDAEESPAETGVFYGRSLLLTPADGGSLTGEKVSLTLGAGLKNYAGKALGAYESGDVPVEGAIPGPAGAVLRRIMITTAPARTDYTEGERFDPAGMVVTAAYSDGSTEKVTNYTYTPGGALTTADQSVTIRYSEGGITVTAELAITVKGSSGGSHYVPTIYHPTITESEHGTVTVSPARATAGNTVTITPLPDAGYAVSAVTVTGPDGREIEVVEKDDGTFSFTQPAGEVTITVTFTGTRKGFDEVDPTEGGDLGNFKASDHYADGMFRDVDPNAWYAGNVRAAVEYGLMLGYDDGRFGVGESLKLSEALAIACRLHNLYYGGSGVFDQSGGGPWYQVYAEYAEKYGILEAEKYDLTAAVSRRRFAEIISAALPDEALAPINEVTALPDVEADDPALPAILRLYDAGILTGVDEYGTFLPDEPISREQIAAVITRVADPALRKRFTLKTK